jgi:hypothetical protein
MNVRHSNKREDGKFSLGAVLSWKRKVKESNRLCKSAGASGA